MEGLSLLRLWKTEAQGFNGREESRSQHLGRRTNKATESGVGLHSHYQRRTKITSADSRSYLTCLKLTSNTAQVCPGF